MKNILISRSASGYIAHLENCDEIEAKTISALVEKLIELGIECCDVSTGNSSADNKLKDIFQACKTGDKTRVKMHQFEFEIRLP